MRKVLIVANCHSLSLARAFTLGARNVEVKFIDLNFLSRENEKANIAELYEGLPSDAVVFSFQTTERMTPVSTKEIATVASERLITFTNIRFDGLHPDMTLIGPRNGRRHSILGTLHSKLIAFAFASGLSKNDCLQLFNYKVYDKLNYFDVFSTSANTLVERDAHCTVKFATKFLSITQDEQSLYIYNHPTGRVFQALTGALCAAADITHTEFADCCMINELSNSYIWPIYNEVAEYHQLRYRTPQYFVTSQSFASRLLSLEEMVAGCYEVYGQHRDMYIHFISGEAFFKPFQEILA